MHNWAYRNEMAELQTKSLKRKHRKKQTDHIKRTSISLIENSIIYSNIELKTMERYLQSTQRKKLSTRNCKPSLTFKNNGEK